MDAECAEEFAGRSPADVARHLEHAQEVVRAREANAQLYARVGTRRHQRRRSSGSSSSDFAVSIHRSDRHPASHAYPVVQQRLERHHAHAEQLLLLLLLLLLLVSGCGGRRSPPDLEYELAELELLGKTDGAPLRRAVGGHERTLHVEVVEELEHASRSSEQCYTTRLLGRLAELGRVGEKGGRRELDIDNAACLLLLLLLRRATNKSVQTGGAQHADVESGVVGALVFACGRHLLTRREGGSSTVLFVVVVVLVALEAVAVEQKLAECEHLSDAAHGEQHVDLADAGARERIARAQPAVHADQWH